MTNQEYLNSIVAKLMANPDWQLPSELRFFLVVDLEWSLQGL